MCRLSQDYLLNRATGRDTQLLYEFAAHKILLHAVFIVDYSANLYKRPRPRSERATQRV